MHISRADSAMRTLRVPLLSQNTNKKSHPGGVAFFMLAERAGLEPAAFRVTGGRYNQLN